MSFDRTALRLYAVTDRAWTGKMTLTQQVEAALRGGATLVQLREKTLDKPTFLAQAVELAALCKGYGVPLIVNDNVDVALESGADGVHLGQEDQAPEAVRRRAGDGFIIGVSAHTVAEARAAQAAGADYLGVGAVFATATKPGVTDMPFETLRSICRAVDIPVVAIGGITRENIPRLAGSGAEGVAVVSAIFASPDPESAARELRALSERMVAGDG